MNPESPTILDWGTWKQGHHGIWHWHPDPNMPQHLCKQRLHDLDDPNNQSNAGCRPCRRHYQRQQTSRITL